MACVVRSYSKINLGLAVGPPRGDGFHGLVTLYQTLALHDRVTVTASRRAETRIRLSSDHPGVPRTETGDAAKNTAYRMVAGALERMGVAAEVAIHIEKRLPVQGGMGAGSANAAAALLGLERELGLELGAAERLELAAEVGSDVPLFLVGGAVLGTGRGEVVEAFPDFARTWTVVAMPEVGVSTRLAFAALDQRFGEAGEPGAGEGGAARGLTQPLFVDKLEKLSRVYAGVRRMPELHASPSGIVRTADPAAGPGTSTGVEGGTANDLAEIQAFHRAGSEEWNSPLLALVHAGVENDFEDVAFSQHPSLCDIKRELLGSGSGQPALYAGLSGSGSALFGLYGDRAAAEAAQQRVQTSGVRAILTETLPRARYWADMFAE